jgi:hypothetical protein
VRLFEADWCCDQKEHSNQFRLDRWIGQGWIGSFRARSLALRSIDHTRLLRLVFLCLDHVARFFRSFSRACGAAQESVELPTVRRASPAHAPPTSGLVIGSRNRKAFRPVPLVCLRGGCWRGGEPIRETGETERAGTVASAVLWWWFLVSKGLAVETTTVVLDAVAGKDRPLCECFLVVGRSELTRESYCYARIVG